MPKNDDHLAQRWSVLARASGIASDEPLTLGLSGGVDSVSLALLAAAGSAPGQLELVHVDHGWRRDPTARATCEALAARLGRPLHLSRLELYPWAPNAEATARRARYTALCVRARVTGRTTLITAHHADDRIENAALRWRRGGRPSGWSEPHRSQLLHGDFPGGSARVGEAPVRLVRPLLSTPGAALRALACEAGADWVEDPSNLDRRHARNAVRHDLLPLLARTAGAGRFAEHLARISRALAELDRRFEAELPLLEPVPWAPFTRTPSTFTLGGTAAAPGLFDLDPQVLARVLGLMVERHTGRPARERTLLDLVRRSKGESGADGDRRADTGTRSGTTTRDTTTRDTTSRRATISRATVGEHWQLVLNASASGSEARVALLPPPGRLGAPPPPRSIVDRDLAPDAVLELGDGRRVTLERVLLELEARAGPPLTPLVIRAWRAGDRTVARSGRPERSTTRDLAENGVPASERPLALVVELERAVSDRRHGALVLGPIPSLVPAALDRTALEPGSPATARSRSNL